jgi:hypothetical protein
MDRERERELQRMEMAEMAWQREGAEMKERTRLRKHKNLWIGLPNRSVIQPGSVLQ